MFITIVYYSQCKDTTIILFHQIFCVKNVKWIDLFYITPTRVSIAEILNLISVRLKLVQKFR